VISERPCSRLTEFAAKVQRRAVGKLATAPTLARMMYAMMADGAFNQAICS
jgi:hypothetical protein